MLLPLKHHGLLFEAPKKSITVKEMDVTAAIAKEARSLKLRSGVDVLPFAVSRTIILRY
jgi:hypothetical protein